MVRRWLCIGHLTRYVLSLGHRVMQSSHTERTLKPHERRAKRVQPAGSAKPPGCPPDPTDLWYPTTPTPWSHCHTTSVNDTVLLCENSHQDLHTGGRTLTLRDGRRLNASGWVHDPP